MKSSSCKSNALDLICDQLSRLLAYQTTDNHFEWEDFKASVKDSSKFAFPEMKKAF